MWLIMSVSISHLSNIVHYFAMFTVGVVGV